MPDLVARRVGSRALQAGEFIRRKTICGYWLDTTQHQNNRCKEGFESMHFTFPILELAKTSDSLILRCDQRQEHTVFTYCVSAHRFPQILGGLHLARKRGWTTGK